jgi:hypothetical protein
MEGKTLIRAVLDLSRDLVAFIVIIGFVVVVSGFATELTTAIEFARVTR